jgi:hypothetical protein
LKEEERKEEELRSKGKIYERGSRAIARLPSRGRSALRAKETESSGRSCPTSTPMRVIKAFKVNYLGMNEAHVSVQRKVEHAVHLIKTRYVL